MSIRPEPDETTGNTPDAAAVRGLLDRLIDDWARGDGEAYGSRFTEDADYVSFDGTHTRGRAEISASHQQLFDTWLKGSRLVGQVESIRFPSPDVALVHATGGTIMRGNNRPSSERNSIQTLIATRRDGEWRFAAFHNTRVRPIGHNAFTALAWILSDLLWKILSASRKKAHG
ncbi:MAG: SgcJ/EcaC family oxidoreductase [Rubrobacteraceae bacterium]